MMGSLSPWTLVGKAAKGYLHGLTVLDCTSSPFSHVSLAQTGRCLYVP